MLRDLCIFTLQIQKKQFTVLRQVYVLEITNTSGKITNKSLFLSVWQQMCCKTHISISRTITADICNYI